MADIIIGVILLAIIAGAITKIVIEKRKGAKCIGCPSGSKAASRGCNCDHLK